VDCSEQRQISETVISTVQNVVTLNKALAPKVVRESRVVEAIFIIKLIEVLDSLNIHGLAFLGPLALVFDSASLLGDKGFVFLVFGDLVKVQVYLFFD
jgi:hypothetical protein